MKSSWSPKPNWKRVETVREGAATGRVDGNRLQIKCWFFSNHFQRSDLAPAWRKLPTCKNMHNICTCMRDFLSDWMIVFYRIRAQAESLECSSTCSTRKTTGQESNVVKYFIGLYCQDSSERWQETRWEVRKPTAQRHRSDSNLQLLQRGQDSCTDVWPSNWANRARISTFI